MVTLSWLIFSTFVTPINMLPSKNKISLLLLSLAFVFFGFQQNCNETPELNKKIVAFVKQNIGKKVSTGECWDLAAEALNKTKAKWDGSYGFGEKVEYQKECVFAGDIIQFKGVKLNYKEGEYFLTETLEHHTAVIYEVKEKGVYIIADQNTRFTGKKVGTRMLELKNITKGTIQIFRPQN